MYKTVYQTRKGETWKLVTEKSKWEMVKMLFKSLSKDIDRRKRRLEKHF